MLLVLALACGAVLAAHAQHAAAGSFAKKMPAHKKYFISVGSQKNMKLINERAIDSYFRTLKSTPISFSALPEDVRSFAHIVRGAPAPSEAPAWQQKRVEEHFEQETSNDKDIQNLEFAKSSVVSTKDSKRNRETLWKPDQKEYLRNSNIYEKHINSEERKPLRAAKDLKLTSDTKDRRPHLAQNFHQKMHASGIKDKILHKTNVNNDRNARSMARMLNDITQKVMDRNSQREREYKKRHTMDKVTNDRERYNENIDIKGRSKNAHTNKNRSEGDSLKKLVRHDMPARIGNYDVAREVKDPPYALFYRMNHEDLDPPQHPAAVARTPVEELEDDSYYAGRVTSFAEGSAGRGATRSLSAMSNKHSHRQHYTAFRDR